MPKFGDMQICPRCQGSTFVDGKDCTVCEGTGVLTKNGGLVSYEDGMQFIDWLEEHDRRRKRFA